MKKISLFVCALAAAVVAFAAPHTKGTKVLQTSNQQMVKAVQLPEMAKPAVFKSKALKAEEEPVRDTLQNPYYVPGTFHYGIYKSGMNYYGMAAIIAPFTEGIEFQNMYGAKSDWHIGEETVGSSAKSVTLPFPGGFGEYDYMPKMITPEILDTTSDPDSLYHFPDYQYGEFFMETLEENFPGEDLTGMQAILIAPSTLNPLTIAATLSENRNNWYGYRDWGTSGAGELGSYSYGSKLQNPWISGRYFDTIAADIPNSGTMYIEHVAAAIYTDGDNIKTALGTDGHIRLTLYPTANTNQGIDWEHPIASAVSTAEDIVGSGWYGMINFYFTEEDELGIESEVQVPVTGDFVAVLDQFNDAADASFGFMTDHDFATIVTTYFPFTYNGNPVASSLWISPNNLMLSFYAILPEFKVEKEEVVLSLEEQSVTFDIPSNVWDEDMYIDYEEFEDWLTVEVVTEYETEFDEEEGEEYWYHKYVNHLTISVKEAAEEREGEIYIDALGKEVTIKVKQTADPQGIEDVNFKKNGKSYNVLGQEVNEDYKGIVIRNGEKFVR